MELAFAYMHKVGGVTAEITYPYLALNGRCNPAKVGRTGLLLGFGREFCL